MGINKIRNSLLIIIFWFLACEISIRFIGHYDIDGNFSILNHRLKPYHLPVKQVDKFLKAYLTHPDSLLMYDSQLGWSPRPGAFSQGGLYCYNSAGLRAASSGDTVTEVHPEGVIRIALFGDSFTHASDVYFKDTWGSQLEVALRQEGRRVEVLNFGVGGYGIDQAFLRYKIYGYKFKPDIVIFGFQPENVGRQVNLVRPIYSLSEVMPFTKPRFVFKGEKLALMNSPTVKAADIEDLLKNFRHWQLAPYEYWYNQKDYWQRIWFESKLFSLGVFLAERIKHPNRYIEKEKEIFAVDSEAARLTVKIIEEFRDEVKRNGGQFYIVHLPDRLKWVLNDSDPPYEELLNKLSEISEIISPEDKIRYYVRKNKCSRKDLLPYHYSPLANAIIADTVKEFLIKKSAN